jgi:outer membrane protein assembly factor BamB
MGGALGGLLVLIWWLFFSRAPWSERLGAIGLVLIAGFLARLLVHPSVSGAGMGMLYYFYALPVLALALVAWAVGTRRLARGPRLAWMVTTIVLAGLIFLVLRIDGISNTEGIEYAWRWSPTAEDRALDQARGEELAPPAPERPTDESTGSPPATAASVHSGESAPVADAAAASDTAPPTTADAGTTAEGLDPGATAPSAPAMPATHEPEWPGFRGPHRDGVIHGVSIETDWAQSPPTELWRRPVGPGWSSFAVDGNRFYTQEQLGEDEVVSCYELETGKPIWRHTDSVRFWEANAGAGPRATPTVHDGRVYSFGGTGILNALDARDGSVAWSRDVAKETEAAVPMWGFASSPLVVADTIVVAAEGKLASYDLATGTPRWTGPKGAGYSSPHTAKIGGIEQILILNGGGVLSLDPRDGKELWKHEWPGDGIVQPAVLDDGSVLVGGSGSGMGGEEGIRRVAITRGPGEWNPEHGTGGWAVEERWTSTGLKPYFNDLVLHEGYAYGFDGAILACIDLQDGQRKWKGGRYGNGQLVLLADQDLLLVLSEKGELALVDANPTQFTERARFKAIDGKTWNHPVIAGDVVLVRNSEEMAAFRVASAGG